MKFLTYPLAAKEVHKSINNLDTLRSSRFVINGKIPLVNWMRTSSTCPAPIIQNEYKHGKKLIEKYNKDIRIPSSTSGGAPTRL